MIPENLVNRQIGPYLLLEQVGVGGMGVVYRATAPGRDDYVAIKVVGEKAPGGPDYQRRFQREIRILSELDHPNILAILDFGVDQDRLYMVMPFVHHGSLSEFLEHGDGILTPAQVGMVAKQVGAALDYAHGKGVVHRDVKPENIMMMGGERICLADFGLAKFSRTTLTSLTSTGSVMGTPSYMSPEQALGTKIDGSTDIYSLGLVLYRCLLGRLPFYADTAIAMINQHISVMPIVPTAINPDFPHNVEAILLKSLEKKPERRYQSAAEMTEELGTALSSLPTGLRTQPLVTPEQIEASTQLDNQRTPLVTAVLPQAGATEPVPESDTHPRRRLLSLAAIAVIIVALALGITAVIRPIQERALHAEQTAQALMELGPIVITQLVTNEAGEPVYIEVTRIVTYMPGQVSPTPSPENTATLTPTATGSPTPTFTPQPATGSSGASEPEPTSTPAPTRTPDSNITQPPYTNTPDPGGGVTRPPQNPTNTPKPGSGVGPQPPTRPTNTPGNSDNESGNDTLSNGG